MKPVSHHEIAQKREQENRKRSGLLSLKSKQEQASSQKPCFPPSISPPHAYNPSFARVGQDTLWGLKTEPVTTTQNPYLQCLLTASLLYLHCV